MTPYPGRVAARGRGSPSVLGRLIALGLIFPASAQAQVDTATVGDEALQYEVVVTGSRTPRALKDAPIATEVINRSAIEKSGDTNLADLLEERPGVELTPAATGVGARGRGLRINGVDGKHVLILVDGERTTGRLGGDLDPTRFFLEDVERVEIVKGASSSLYGSDAIGGVVNIITRRARAPFTAELNVRGGGFDTGKPCCRADASASVGVRAGPISSQLSGGFHFEDRFDLDPDLPGDTRGQLEAFDVTNRTEYRLTDDVRLTAHGDYRRADQAALDVVGRALVDRTQRSDVWSAGIGGQADFGSGGSLQVKLSFSDFRLQILQVQRGDDDLDSLDDIEHQLAQSSLQYDRRFFDDHFVSAGIEGLFETQSGALIAADVQDRLRGAAFVQDEWTVIDDQQLLSLLPGVRLDLDSNYGAQVSPRLALRWDPTADVIVRASYGWGYRAPDFEERFLDFVNTGSGYRVVGDPDLSVETSQNAHVGVEWRAVRWCAVTAGLYWNEFDDLIDTVRVEATPGGLSQFRYANIGEAFTRGGEISARVTPLKGVSLSAGYALTDTENRQTGRPLEGRALHRGTFGASWRQDDWGFGINAKGSVTGRRRYVDRSAPPFAQIDVRANKSLFEYFSIYAGVDNVLDAGEPQVLPLPPRTVFAGITARYRMED